MTVYFIGAGPGAPDLITLRGRNLIQRCPVCLYAGSLVPQEVIDCVPVGSEVLDSSSMTLEEIITVISKISDKGLDVARVHSGDLSVFGAIAEQMRALEDLGIAYEVVPGVPAYAAAAAVLKAELTLPGVSQTVILTRTEGKASAMPDNENLESIASTGATLAIHLSIRFLSRIVRTLLPFYGPACPVRIVYRASWPDQIIITGTLTDIVKKVRPYKITRTALILVGWVFNTPLFQNSALYDPHHVHVFRPKRHYKRRSQEGP